MTEILPALLEQNLKEFKRKLELIKPLAKRVQVDFGDGQFVNNRTLDLGDVGAVVQQTRHKGLRFEAHLMIHEPGRLVDAAASAGFSTIILHVEARGVSIGLVERIKRQLWDIELGLAINPETLVEKIVDYQSKVDLVLCMTVQPGFQGRPFIPEVLKKIPRLQTLGFSGIVEVDGGINLATIGQCVQAGAERLVVGSGLWTAKNVQQRWTELNNQLEVKS